MGPACSDVRQSRVSASRAAPRMSDYRTDTQGPFFLGLGNWDDWKAGIIDVNGGRRAY